MKKGASKSLKAEQQAELTALAALPDDAIDTSDAPELLDWSGAKRGLFYRPVKQQLTLRVDADVIAWFKAQATSRKAIRRKLIEHSGNMYGVRLESACSLNEHNFHGHCQAVSGLRSLGRFGSQGDAEVNYSGYRFPPEIIQQAI